MTHEEKVNKAFDELVEEGKIVITGFTKDGKPLYSLKEYAEKNNIDYKKNMN